MEWLTIVYLIYIFISLYFLVLLLLIYIPNKKRFLEYPPITKKYPLSIIIPCYNEADTIGSAIESFLESDYKNLKKLIVVDDCSKDNSYEIIKKYAKKYPQVMALQTPKNTGKAAGSKNYGAKHVKTELIGFGDADSYPKKDAISKMIGFFDDKKVGAVTSMILVKKRKKFIEKLQAIEYKIIAFTRKLLGFVDSIYVTPGPLAIYRKKAFDEVGGFDENNWTEDIEITWHIVSKGYNVKMSSLSRVYTVAPNKFKMWFKQRLRWNVGGIQTINKYKTAFKKTGMLGAFILPFFVSSWIIGITGLIILGYRFTRSIITRYLATNYSIEAQTAIITLKELNLAPSILVFFGLSIFIFSLSFTGIALMRSKEEEFKRHGILNILAYMLFYLSAYPPLLIVSIYQAIKGKKTW